MQWLARFEDALAARITEGVRSCFAEDAYWRDLVAFTWDIGWVHGAEAIARALLSQADARGRVMLRLSDSHPPPRNMDFLGNHLIEVFFDLDTSHGRGSGIARLLRNEEPPGIRAWCLLTTLESFHDTRVPRAGVGNRRASLGYDRTHTGKNWINHRQDRQAYADRDPRVLVVGGGHAGLFPAVELGLLGVDCLVVDRHPRIGDNWRTRYHSLALHTPTDVSQFPYLSYPETFPSYLPKDQLANWIETYVDALEINYWTSTEFIGASFDEQERRWTARIKQADGSPRELHPCHLIMATGFTGGVPNVPSLPGLDQYRGERAHSSQFGSAVDYARKRVLVIGSGTSGHDISYDLHQHGAHVTMMQRGPTTIIDLSTSELPFVEAFNGATSEETNLLLYKMSYIFPLLQRSLQEFTALSNALDSDLLERLKKVGFLVDDGEDHTGHIMKVHRSGSGYYINVGCSDLIASGAISLLHARDLSTFTENGVRLRDGTLQEFELVVLATGFLKPERQLRSLFGDEVMDRVGDVGGLDDTGEYANMFKRTKQVGLWFSGGGGIYPCRAMAKYLALLIKATMSGAIPKPAPEVGPVS
jgi:putative flavoprotein involved in K+ transport